ncbi:MAG: SH3 domain-containing protein [Treponema sp.]|nr:SH3 domain-containing protein [Spirochaetia bacterium]MDD7458612.1 SH3 domain-containing protein [Spirochaetales bacterium]MDY5810700.1 SH3 domain-containing protein [Treponema sp.]MEE1182417.1 SH3 domain-containing protein [Treponema sp.]
MKFNLKFSGIFFALILSILLSSCSGIIGYGVLLWNDNEHKISDGTVVPVYLKSNISKVYVIALPDTKEKVEVPLWQLSAPEKKSRANKLAAKYAEYKNTYAKSAIDGLPIRADKVNTSKQVYRLRKNETVKIMYKGKGVAPQNGGVPLEGEWLHVLTSGGTEGWCFSYNLRPYTMLADDVENQNQAVAETDEEEADTLIEGILNTVWYPEYYGSMISKKQIDLNFFNTTFKFAIDENNSLVTMALPEMELEFAYKGVTKTEEKEYDINETPLQLTVRNKKSIVVKYTDEKGMPASYNFISLGDKNPDQIIAEEVKRRQNEYKMISSFGPDFKSGNYGKISFNDGNEITWSGFNKLVPSVIPAKAKGRGFVEIKYFVPSELKSAWDGVLTFVFEGSNKEINFFYKKEENGIRLTAGNVLKRFDSKTGREISTVSLPSNSIVMFFQK